ncbi:MAG: aromatic ring-hydroxylating dioxygenase subunit alpha [Bacteroidetes bacterium]|nr:MAG: aromatic ring-hydroxylating dioxygenase subunit alpha [Bacteroidota bacterium]
MYKVNEDIRKATTLPASFYRDKTTFYKATDRLLSSSWQLIGDDDLFAENINSVPFIFYNKILNEPLLLIKQNDGAVQCLSNVCTHRGNLLIDKPGKHNKLLCGYHGRRFGLDGNFEQMPEFEKAEDFPRACDSLVKIETQTWEQFIFINLNPSFDFKNLAESLNERVGFLPISSFIKSTERSKEYKVNAHWALYCDNYLEGFHIPFVHPALNQAVEYSTYETVLYDYCNLQIGYAKDDTETFDLPEGHPDYGKNVAAYYYWVFPNLMLNFYPWGLSVNIVRPIDHQTTNVSFISYVYDETKIDSSAGALLDKVEMEDEEVVQGVQKGIQSRYYNTGRFSPTREQGVHHFHRLIAEIIREN